MRNMSVKWMFDYKSKRVTAGTNSRLTKNHLLHYSSLDTYIRSDTDSEWWWPVGGGSHQVKLFSDCTSCTLECIFITGLLIFIIFFLLRFFFNTQCTEFVSLQYPFWGGIGGTNSPLFSIPLKLFRTHCEKKGRH